MNTILVCQQDWMRCVQVALHSRASFWAGSKRHLEGPALPLLALDAPLILPWNHLLFEERGKPANRPVLLR